MTDTVAIQSRIRSFVSEKFPTARRRVLKDSDPLLESGIIDSLGVLDVIKFLEQAFTIRIEDEELTPDNFGSIQLLALLVQKKLSAFEAPTV